MPDEPIGDNDRLTLEAPLRREVPPLPAGVMRRRPRAHAEWKALRRWGKLPAWEAVCPGYMLREARERAGITQS